MQFWPGFSRLTVLVDCYQPMPSQVLLPARRSISRVATLERFQLDGGLMSTKPNRWPVCLFVAICITSTGCGLRPNWGPQGTIGAQRERAVLHDPFPSNELGPPIMGGRPVGFEQPRSETTSLQNSPYASKRTRGAKYTPTNGF